MIQSNLDQKMAYGCSGVVFGMFELEKGILTNFHKKKNQQSWKTCFVLGDLRCWRRDRWTWFSEKGIKQIWNHNFGIFVNFDMVTRVFTSSYARFCVFIDPNYASLNFVNNINFSASRVNKIRYYNNLFKINFLLSFKGIGNSFIF